MDGYILNTSKINLCELSLSHRIAHGSGKKLVTFRESLKPCANYYVGDRKKIKLWIQLMYVIRKETFKLLCTIAGPKGIASHLRVGGFRCLGLCTTVLCKPIMMLYNIVYIFSFLMRSESMLAYQKKEFEGMTGFVIDENVSSIE